MDNRHAQKRDDCTQQGTDDCCPGRHLETTHAICKITTHGITHRQRQHGGGDNDGPDGNGAAEHRRQDTRNPQFHDHDRGTGNSCQRQARVCQILPGFSDLAIGLCICM